MIGRALVLVVVFGALQLGWQLMDGNALAHLVIDRTIAGRSNARA